MRSWRTSAAHTARWGAEMYTRPAWMTVEFCALLDKVYSEIYHETGREPETAEIAVVMHESDDTIEAALQARSILISEGGW